VNLTNDCAWIQAALEVIELENASLWWAGKEILKGKTLDQFVGKNDKTKVICKLQKVINWLMVGYSLV
jgi:cilia- and flagella-associated protein 298